MPLVDDSFIKKARCSWYQPLHSKSRCPQCQSFQSNARCPWFQNNLSSIHERDAPGVNHNHWRIDAPSVKHSLKVFLGTSCPQFHINEASLIKMGCLQSQGVEKEMQIWAVLQDEVAYVSFFKESSLTQFTLRFSLGYFYSPFAKVVLSDFQALHFFSFFVLALTFA